MMKNNPNSAYDTYDYELTTEQMKDLLSLDFLSAEDVEESCVLEAEKYDFDKMVCSDGKKNVAGFYLSYQLQSDPLVRESQRLSRDEKAKRMAELRDIYKNENSSQQEKCEAVYKAMCYMYAFVRTLVKRYCSGYFTAAMTQEDYIQAALITISKELVEYDERMSITSFFYLRIKHDLIEQVASNQNVSRYYNEQLTKVRKVYYALAADGKTPQAADIEYLLPNVSPKTIQKCLEFITTAVVDFDSVEQAVSQNLTPQDECERKEKAEFIKEAMKRLSDNEKKIIAYSYGIGNCPELSQKRLAEIMGLPVDQVRKIKTLAEKKLRKELIKCGLHDTAQKKRQKSDKDKISSTLTFVPLMGDNSDLMSLDFDDDSEN